ncbi:MAG: HEAT repeat domain-containing protein [Myxococcales bacterium]|nr:HEAT repeat domain-containing protein [Myxococcales bacterium]
MIRALSMLSLLSLPAVATAGDWRASVDAAVAQCEADPAPCRAAESLLIRQNRAGYWVVQDDAIDDPSIVGPLLHRFLHTQDPSLQLALADALTRAMRGSEGSFVGAWADLASTHDDAGVRATLVRGMRRAPYAVADAGLRAAARHADPGTRAAAFETMGGHAQVAEFVPELLAATADTQPEVRMACVRALSWSKDARGLQAVRQLAEADPDERVRQRAKASLR